MRNSEADIIETYVLCGLYVTLLSTVAVCLSLFWKPYYIISSSSYRMPIKSHFMSWINSSDFHFVTVHFSGNPLEYFMLVKESSKSTTEQYELS